MDFFLNKLPIIKDILKENVTPLIWTADFILDNDANGKDAYALGEINCSCVGFSTHLDVGIQEKMAKEAIRQATAKKITDKKKSICIFECIGGKDKGPDGNRKESVLIIEELIKVGWYGEIVKF